jgi:hypothetical protein
MLCFFRPILLYVLPTAPQNIRYLAMVLDSALSRWKEMLYTKSQLPKCGARKLFAEGTFTLNKIWAQDKIYILVGYSLGWTMKLALLYALCFTINLEMYVMH